MTLIACPECGKEVSDFAQACPGCGFPVTDGIRYSLEELTEGDEARSARQQHAAAKLRVWGERYGNPERGKEVVSQDDTFLDRHWKPIIVLFVTIILVLQLTWVFSLFG